MAKKLLQPSEIDAISYQVDSEGMSQSVWMYIDSGESTIPLNDVSHL